jgi:streptogramin lyase
MRRILLLAATLILAATALAGSRPAPVETAVIPTGQEPCGVVAARDGGLWVGVYGTGKVLRIDPQRGKVTTTVQVGRWACRVVVGPAAVWVTRDQAGEIVRISRGTGRLARVKVGAGAFDVVLAGGSVWATSFDTGAISRFDAATTKLVRVYKDGPNPAGITSCRGRIWVGHGRNARWLTAIEPSTNRVQRVAVGTSAPGWPSCIRGKVWVTTPDTILRVDPRTGSVLSRLRIDETLAYSAEAPDGLVWVTDKQHSVVHRVTMDGRSVVDSFAAGPGAFALARLSSSMWVTSFAGSDVRRFDP